MTHPLEYTPRGLQRGPFNPADLDHDGCFNVNRFFRRLRRKHGKFMTARPEMRKRIEKTPMFGGHQ